ncbi:hypothetical protein ACLOAV_010723 [Pseudogymnoascus australis]
MQLYLILSALGISTTVQAGIKVNYYHDGGCSDYAFSTTDVPYYEYHNLDPAGTNSVNIANCNVSPEKHCRCTFFADQNGGGKSVQADNPGKNCASNWGSGFKSFYCYPWGL